EGDQILVKVLAIEGNRIKLSRKAVLREQRAKLGLPEVAQPANGGAHESDASNGRRREAVDEAHGDDEEEDFEDDGEELDEESNGEPNFNREDAPAVVGERGPGAPGGPSGQRRPGGGGGRRRRGGRRPQGGGGGNR